MAATLAGRRLTEAHRLAQSRLGRQIITEMLTAWRILDPQNIDATTSAWLRVVTPIIQLRRANSARLAGNYLATFRALEYGTSEDFVPSLSEVVTLDQLVTSLTVTGPVALKRAMGATSLALASQSAQIGSARAAQRLALNGSRDTIRDSVANDTAALGWARVTSGDPCSFCRMLASRGPVYSKDTVDFEAHDGCACQNEPVFSRDAEWPPGSRDYQRLWQQAKTSKPDGVTTAVQFRRLVEGRA